MNNQKGSLTIFFLLFLGVIFFVTSLGLYVGRSTSLKIKLVNAADSSVMSMGNHYAGGLNLISAQNIAIGAQIHTASAMNFFGRYWALGEALTCTGIKDLLSGVFIGKPECSSVALYLALGNPAADNDKKFGKIFKFTKIISAVFMQSAVGLTRMNQTIADTWFIDTSFQGIENLRKNAPGAVAIPFKGLFSDSKKKPSPTFNFKSNQLKTSNVEALFCHSISSSKAIGSMRDTAMFWVEGWVNSVTNSPINKIIKLLKDAEHLLRNLPILFASELDKIDEKLFGSLRKSLNVAHTECNSKNAAAKGVKTICNAYSVASKKSEIAKNALNLLIPSFGECGLNDGFGTKNILNSGNYGKQAQSFFDHQGRGSELGFMYPDLNTEAELAQWHNDHEIQLMALRPTSILMPDNQSESNCPHEWIIQATSGKKICNAPMSNLDFNQFEKFNPQKILSRYQVALSHVAVQYDPTNDDPRAASTEGYISIADAINRSRFQLFWPAWRPKLQDVSLGALEYMGFLAP